MSSRKCPQCGLVNWASAESCKRCALDFTPEAEPSPAGEFPPQDAQQPYSAPPYNNYSYAPPAQQKRTGMALASLILGAVGFATLGVMGVGAVVGLVIGIIALKKARQNPTLYGGEGWAIAGIVLNTISVVSVAFILIIAAIAVPNLLAARRAANEAGAIVTLRRIASAQATYNSTLGYGRGYASLQELADKGLVEPSLAKGTKYGYRFDVQLGTGSFELTATPLTYGQTSSPGKRSFYLSSGTGYVVHAADKKGLPADAYDPPLIRDNDDDAYRRRRSSSSSTPSYAQEY